MPEIRCATKVTFQKHSREGWLEALALAAELREAGYHSVIRGSVVSMDAPLAEVNAALERSKKLVNYLVGIKEEESDGARPIRPARTD